MSPLAVPVFGCRLHYVVASRVSAPPVELHVGYVYRMWFFEGLEHPVTITAATLEPEWLVEATAIVESIQFPDA